MRTPLQWMAEAFGPIDLDAYAEALEHMEGASLDLLAPDPALDAPADPRDLTGQRFGHLLVLAPVVRQRHCRDEQGRPRVVNGRDWLVRCDCGRESVIRASHLRNGQQWCVKCSAQDRGRQLSKAADGVLVAEAARRAGLQPNAVWHRIRRGYPRSLWLEAPHAGSGRRRTSRSLAA